MSACEPKRRQISLQGDRAQAVLEASNIPWKPLHAAYLGCMSICMPLPGWLATGGDASAYS